MEIAQYNLVQNITMTQDYFTCATNADQCCPDRFHAGNGWHRFSIIVYSDPLGRQTSLRKVTLVAKAIYNGVQTSPEYPLVTGFTVIDVEPEGLLWQSRWKQKEHRDNFGWHAYQLLMRYINFCKIDRDNNRQTPALLTAVWPENTPVGLH
jgi:hypothetical protein